MSVSHNSQQIKFTTKDPSHIITKPTMTKYELVFIPSLGLSHLASTVEMAKLLLDRDQRLLITVLIMKLSNDRATDEYTQSVSSNDASPRLRFVDLPVQESSDSDPTSLMFDYIEGQIVRVREIVSSLVGNPNSKLAGLVLDMFCTKFADVADEFEVPSYVFFTSGTCGLGIMFHLLTSLKFEGRAGFEDRGAEVRVPYFSKPVPAKVFPYGSAIDAPMAERFLNVAKKLKEVRGVMINTFYELDAFAIDSMRADGSSPRVYPVGPILDSNAGSKRREEEEEIVRWLDGQPEKSVVFLCFGSMGSFDEAQIKEIAKALESSGHRFLWSLRRRGGKGKGFSLPSEYGDFREVLPEGFLERTDGIGKLVGWAPQTAILSHGSVGGFVSHCGWNSVLESVWFGVPIATFPLYAEQQQNAFLLVRELGIAEEIRIDYRMDFSGENPPEIVGSEEIEAAIRRLMRDEAESCVRRKVEEMKERSRLALTKGGSSYMAQNLFIEDVIRNVS